jgi:hypothetical protein
MKIKCNLCSRRVEDDDLSKWKHVAEYHAQDAIKKILPFLANPDRAEIIGRNLARRLANPLDPFSYFGKIQ